MSYARMKEAEGRLAADVDQWFEEAARIDAEPGSRILKGPDGFVQAAAGE